MIVRENEVGKLVERRNPGRGLAGFGIALCASMTLFAASTRADENAPARLEYNRDVRPILAETCFRCHGPDSAARKADLRLDRREAAVEIGAITPGDVEASTLVERIFSTDPTEVMPPPSTKKSLTKAQKETLKRWIAEGAEYQLHWSFMAPKRPAPPKVRDESWARNPIDRFVLTKLEENGLKPAPEADRRTLARRLSLDLTGLPPAQKTVEAFVNDTGDDAYERYVDALLASERWGEHRGRHWLDVARYADTHGIHFDNYRENWVFRDWVINAFNRNLPFDAFTLEQLAGDLLPDRTPEQQVASGFNRCHMTTNEGGAINEEYLVLYTRDRTETASQVWLGLTTGCAVCHDHKFDPISQREFYELAAFFNNTTQGAMDGNIKDTPPVVFVPRDVDRPRWDSLATETKDLEGQIESRRKSVLGDLDKRLAELPAGTLGGQIPAEGLRLLAPLSEGQGSVVQVTAGGAWRLIDLGAKPSWVAGQVAEKALLAGTSRLEIPEAGDFEKDQAFSYGAWVQLPRRDRGGAVVARLDEGNGHRGWDLWIENERIAAHVINTWPDDAMKVVARDALPADRWNHLFVTYDGSGKASGLKLYVNGREQAVTVAEDRLKSTIRTNAPLTVGQRRTGGRLNPLHLQDLRVYSRALAAGEVESIARSTRSAWLASRPADKRTDAEKTELVDGLLASADDEFRALSGRLATLNQEKAAIKTRGTIAYVMQEKSEPPMAFVLFRGDYDKRKDEVKPGTPAVLPPMPADQPKNRLGLARWLLRPENPLTSRVTVNRFWQEVFGAGIVRTSGDFGVSGELPTHPELLDWLAVDFVENGWDVKRFFKLIVTSATYRQSARTTREKLEKDPRNQLLSRGPRYRMDAEMVRDYALASGGLLVPKIGGPSVRPYQPEGVWEAVAMIGSNTRDYKPDKGEALYRRSLYTFWKRAAPPASMDIFNAPSREICTVRRERTNTPLQALVTLNDPQFVEAARHLAQHVLKEASTTDDRLDLMARRLLARPLVAEEQTVVNASLADLLNHYEAHPSDAKALTAVGESKPDPSLEAPTLAAWTMLANEMLNLDEVLNK